MNDPRATDEIATADHIGLFETSPGDPSALPAIPVDESLDAYARAWLDVNCSYCHRPGGTTQADFDIRYTTALADTNTCDVDPMREDLDITDARLIAPGDPSRSVLFQRLTRRDRLGMPPLASAITDPEGVDALETWSPPPRNGR